MNSNLLLLVNNLSYTLPKGQILFDPISLSLEKGEVVGLVGKNGIGKTTLLNLIAGAIPIQQGSVQVNTDLSYFRQVVPLDAQTIQDLLDENTRNKLMAYQSIIEGSQNEKLYKILNDEWDIESRIMKVLKNIGIDKPLNTDLNTLSGGQITQVRLALIFESNSLITIMDEPTNNLDFKMKKWLYNKIQGHRGGILFVSHDRELLNLSSKIYELSNLGFRSYKGHYEDYSKTISEENTAVEQRLKHAKKELNKKTKGEQIKRVKATARAIKAKQRAEKTGMDKIQRNAKISQSQASSARQKAVSAGAVANARSLLEVERSKVREKIDLKFSLNSSKVPEGKIVIKLDNVSFSYSNKIQLFDNISYEMRGSARVRIHGPNGSGKSTLLKLITGELSPWSGEIRRIEEIAYIDQRTQLLISKMSLLENYRQINPDQSKTEARNRLAQFLFRRDSVNKAVKSLSGGERMRAYLSILLSSTRPPKLLILDEPTNHIDLDSIKNLEDTLSHYQGAMVVVSHDEEFIKNIGIDETLNCKSKTYSFSLEGKGKKRI